MSRIDFDTPLSHLPPSDLNLTASAIQRLEACWITTVGDLLQTLAHTGIDVDLSDLLDADAPRLRHLQDRLWSALPAEAAKALCHGRPHALGMVLDQAPAPADAVSLAPTGAPLPNQVNLISDMPPVRNQGSRPTCVAFATGAVHEWEQDRRQPAAPLSPQHLYYLCKQNDGYHGPGTYISMAVRLIRTRGQCREATWPYNPNAIPGNQGQGPPPHAAEQEAGDHRIFAALDVSGDQVEPIQRILAGFDLGGRSLVGRPVVFGVPLFGSFFGGETARSGKVTLPLPGERIRGGHAMVFVGYRVHAGAPGGGYFIVRNSWGQGWAPDNPDGPGHCWLPFAYVAQYGRSHVWATLQQREVRGTAAAASLGGADIGHQLSNGQRVTLPLPLFRRHVVGVGSAGSGKTSAGKRLCEAALTAGIPVLAIDIQGDMATMAGRVSPEEAQRRGRDPADLDALSHVETAIYTPGSDYGVPICSDPLSALRALPRPLQARESLETLEMAATLLLDQLDGVGPARYPFARNALIRTLRHGHEIHVDLDLDDVVRLLDDPPPALSEGLSRVISDSDLDRLRRALNGFANSSARALLDQGVPMDIDRLVRATEPGKTRLSVLYLNCLTSMQSKQAFVALFAESLHRWMLQQGDPPDAAPRVLLFIDEVGAFIPNPTAKKPVCKDALIRLFKEGRKYGVGFLAFSQSPSDFDFRALGQARSVLTGSLRTPQETRQVGELMGGRLGNVDLGGFAPGEMLLSVPDIDNSGPLRIQVDQTLFADGIASPRDLPALQSERLRRRLLTAAPTPRPRSHHLPPRPAEAASITRLVPKRPTAPRLPRVITPAHEALLSETDARQRLQATLQRAAHTAHLERCSLPLWRTHAGPHSVATNAATRARVTAAPPRGSSPTSPYLDPLANRPLIASDPRQLWPVPPELRALTCPPAAPLVLLPVWRVTWPHRPQPLYLDAATGHLLLHLRPPPPASPRATASTTLINSL